MENLLNLPRQPDRWYREPWLLLVFGGPVLVVLACIATIYLAIKHPDPVISKDYYREGVRINAKLAAQQAAQRAATSATPTTSATTPAAAPAPAAAAAALASNPAKSGNGVAP